VDETLALGCCCGDDIGEAGAQVGDHELGTMETGGAHDHGGVTVVGGTEPTTGGTESFGEHLDLCTETAQSLGVAEAVLVDGLMDHTDPVGLGEGGDER